jgi:DNA-binding CsgD family transcriptional regulator
MTLLQRLLRTMGVGRPSRLSFQMDEEMVESLREMAYNQRRPKEELAADLLSEALMRRLEEEKKLEYWRSLSPREQEIVALVCLDYTNRQIADRLVISPETVKTHVANVLRKYNLRRRSDLRQYLDNWDFSAWDPPWVPPPSG